MNILIPHSWLLEHLDTAATPDEIQKQLSLSGPSVERIYDREGESVYDIEVTTNRVDSMSVRGIAREAAVILTQAGLPSSLKPLPQYDVSMTTELPLPTIVQNAALCKRVVCIVLKDVQRTPTPSWMAARLTQTDQNVHDSVIDITNYITHELGHPCHAFDYDKVMELGGEITVTEARPGETFTTLDGTEYQTVGGEVVFKNPVGAIIDLPAIKGTANTSISETTKNVLLWAETLDAQKVRYASMTHAIRTVAAQLSEKNVDANLAELVIKRGAELYRELCHATIASKLYDDFPGNTAPQPVTVTLQRVSDYLGILLEKQQIKTILGTLECAVELNGETLVVTPPTFRPDIAIAADIIEEIARIYGYHNLPSKLMDTAIPIIRQSTTDFVFEGRIKHFLVDLGWQELYSYSMVSDIIAQQSGHTLESHLKLQNPLTEDRVYLRRSLIPSLLEILEQNSGTAGLQFFELAHAYHPIAGELPAQELYLTLLSAKPYREVRGTLESLLSQFFITPEQLRIVPLQESTRLASQSGEVWVDTTILGTIHFLRGGQAAIELSLAALQQVAKSHPSYKSIPKTPEVKEDLTFTLPEQIPVGPVLATLRGADSQITGVRLASVYNQNYTFSLTYWHAEKSLTAAEIETIRKAVVSAVQTAHNASLVGTV